MAYRPAGGFLGRILVLLCTQIALIDLNNIYISLNYSSHLVEMLIYCCLVALGVLLPAQIKDDCSSKSSISFPKLLNANATLPGGFFFF